MNPTESCQNPALSKDTYNEYRVCKKGNEGYFRRIFDALEYVNDNDRIKVYPSTYNEEVAVCKSIELIAHGLVYLNKLTVIETCTVRGLHIGHLDVVQGKSVYLIDCLVDQLSANCKFFAIGCKIESLQLIKACHTKLQNCEIYGFQNHLSHSDNVVFQECQFNKSIISCANSSEIQFNNNILVESAIHLSSCKYVELTRNRILNPLGDALLFTGDSVVCCEFNEISGVKQSYSSICLKEQSGANLQNNLIQNSMGTGVTIQVHTCGVRMENNIIAGVSEAINVK